MLASLSIIDAGTAVAAATATATAAVGVGTAVGTATATAVGTGVEPCDGTGADIVAGVGIADGTTTDSLASFVEQAPVLLATLIRREVEGLVGRVALCAELLRHASMVRGEDVMGSRTMSSSSSNSSTTSSSSSSISSSSSPTALPFHTLADAIDHCSSFISLADQYAYVRFQSLRLLLQQQRPSNIESVSSNNHINSNSNSNSSDNGLSTSLDDVTDVAGAGGAAAAGNAAATGGGGSASGNGCDDAVIMSTDTLALVPSSVPPPPSLSQYCWCRGVEDGSIMVQCDGCDEWFHSHCVGITPQRLRERQKKLQQQQQQGKSTTTTTSVHQGIEASTAATVVRTKTKAKSKSKQMGEAIDELFFCIACCELKQQPYPFAW